MELSATLSLWGSHVIGNQHKRVVATDIVFAQRRVRSDMLLNVFNGLAQFCRQIRDEMQLMDIAGYHGFPFANVKMKYCFNVCP
ncbi:hypothetical protein D3C73_1455530 [compost metagenome]